MWVLRKGAFSIICVVDSTLLTSMDADADDVGFCECECEVYVGISCFEPEGFQAVD